MLIFLRDCPVQSFSFLGYFRDSCRASDHRRCFSIVHFMKRTVDVSEIQKKLFDAATFTFSQLLNNIRISHQQYLKVIIFLTQTKHFWQQKSLKSYHTIEASSLDCPQPNFVPFSEPTAVTPLFFHAFSHILLAFRPKSPIFFQPSKRCTGT